MPKPKKFKIDDDDEVDYIPSPEKANEERGMPFIYGNTLRNLINRSLLYSYITKLDASEDRFKPVIVHL